MMIKTKQRKICYSKTFVKLYSAVEGGWGLFQMVGWINVPLVLHNGLWAIVMDLSPIKNTIKTNDFESWSYNDNHACAGTPSNPNKGKDIELRRI